MVASAQATITCSQIWCVSGKYIVGVTGIRVQWVTRLPWQGLCERARSFAPDDVCNDSVAHSDCLHSPACGREITRPGGGGGGRIRPSRVIFCSVRPSVRQPLWLHTYASPINWGPDVNSLRKAVIYLITPGSLLQVAVIATNAFPFLRMALRLGFLSTPSTVVSSKRGGRHCVIKWNTEEKNLFLLKLEKYKSKNNFGKQSWRTNVSTIQKIPCALLISFHYGLIFGGTNISTSILTLIINIWSQRPTAPNINSIRTSYTRWLLLQVPSCLVIQYANN